jgi:hypothetical protein
MIDGRRRLYPADVFEQLWLNVEALIVAGQVVCSREVVTELEAGDEDCLSWAKSQSNFIVEADQPALAVVSDIANTYPDWSSGGKNTADPFVIAEAETRGWTVVTQEKMRGPGVEEHNMNIPNVCDTRGVVCISFLEMMQREGWKF